MANQARQAEPPLACPATAGQVPARVADFAEKIGRILDEPQLRDRLSTAATRRVADEGDMDRIARRFLDGVGKLLAMRGKP